MQVDLSQLEQVEHTWLPDLMDEARATAEKVDLVAGGHGNAGGGGRSAFDGTYFEETGQLWFDACRDLADTVWAMEETLSLTRGAMRTIIASYAAADATAAATLDRPHEYL